MRNIQEESAGHDHSSRTSALSIIGIVGLVVLLVGSVKIGFAVRLVLGLAVAGMAAAGCLWLIRYGFRAKRVGDTPFCKACGYNLTGLTSNACPECGGAVTPDAIIYGELRRRRRPLIAMTGIVGLLVLTVIGARFGRQVNWYQLQPAALLIWNLSSSDTNAVSRAWYELDRRDKAGSLSRSHQIKLIDIGLEQQGAPIDRPYSGNMINYLGKCYANGLMSAKQESTFFEQIVRLSCRVRPKVILGEGVPVQVDTKSRCPTMPSMWIRVGNRIDFFVDGRLTDTPLRGGGSFAGGAGGSSGTRVQCDQPGKHVLAVKVPIRVYLGPFGKSDASELCYENQISLKAAFEIVESPPLDSVSLINDPSLKQELAAAILPGPLVRRHWRRGDRIEIKIHVDKLPVGVAFDVIARHGNGEMFLTTLSMSKGKTSNFVTASSTAPAEDKIDLIFRTNPEVARKTVDIFEIWDGEIVYKDVQIESRD